jgi:hypothetical protein
MTALVCEAVALESNIILGTSDQTNLKIWIK